MSAIQGLAAVPEVMQILQAIVSENVQLRAELQRQLELKKRLPIMGNRVRTRVIDGKGEREVIRPEGDYPSTFNPRMSDILDITSGLGNFGEDHQVSIDDILNHIELEDFISIFARYSPPQHEGYMIDLYQNRVSLLEAMSWKRETQLPSLLQQLTSVPIRPIGTTELGGEEETKRLQFGIRERMEKLRK